MDYVIALIQEVLSFCSKLLDTFYIKVFTGGTETHHYKAEFGSANQLLSRYNHKGLCIDGVRRIKPDLPHLMVFGPSGYGKTSVIIYPTVLKTEGSFIIYDPSQQIYHNTAGYLHSQNVEVRVINFTDSSKDGFNALAYVKTVADAQKLSALLVRAVLPNKNSDPFWNTAACSVITLCIKLLLHHPVEYRHFAGVRKLVQMLTYDEKQVDILIAQTKSEELISDYKTYLKLEPKVKMSVLATCSSALDIFSDPVLAKITSCNTINIDVDYLRKKRVAIYLHTSIGDFKHYSCIISMLFEIVMNMLMSKISNKKSDLYVYLILEELSSMYIPGLEQACCNLRKSKGVVVAILQSFQDLVNIYNRQAAESIRNNCYSKIYFPGLDQSTLEELSKQLGKYSYFDDNGKQLGVRELLTSDELRTMEDQIIWMCGNYPPMKLSVTPYYENYFLELKTKIPPPSIEGRIPLGAIPYLNAQP